MFTVYALYNKKHGKLYIGQSKNLEERIRLHDEKTFRNSYTRRFDGNWQLIYSEGTETRKDALIREKQLKSYRGREFIKTFIPL